VENRFEGWYSDELTRKNLTLFLEAIEHRIRASKQEHD